MNWTEYLPLAEKTLSMQFNCDDDFHKKILHAVIGSLTEVEEILDNYDSDILITDVNKQGSIAEESADIFWYISILFRELDIRNHNYKIDSEFKTDTPFKTLLSFTKLNLKFLDLIKKKTFYNKEMDRNTMVDYSIKMHALITHFCNLYNTDVDSILEKNISKLKARYGDKFTSERAINRDLKVEREILEGNKPKVTIIEDMEEFPYPPIPSGGFEGMIDGGTSEFYVDGVGNPSIRKNRGTSDHYLD